MTVNPAHPARMVCILSSQGDLHEHPKLSPTTPQAEAFLGSDRCPKYRSQTWPFKQFQRRNSRKTNQSTLRRRNAPRLHSYARRSHCGFRSEDQRPACPASLTMRKAIAVLNRKLQNLRWAQGISSRFDRLHRPRTHVDSCDNCKEADSASSGSVKSGHFGS